MVIYNLILEYHNKGQDKRSYSALAPLTPNSKLQQVVHSLSTAIPVAGIARCVGGTPVPNSLRFRHFIIDDVQPGQQDQDFRNACHLGIKKGRTFVRPLIDSMGVYIIESNPFFLECIQHHFEYAVLILFPHHFEQPIQLLNCKEHQK